MKSVFSKAFESYREAVLQVVGQFDSSGELLVRGKRNTLKVFSLNGLDINVKAFKVPHFINAFIYRWIRPSKARRSFEYAQKLTELQIGTPAPIAYFEEGRWLMGRSYYVCQHLNADFTFRALVDDPQLPEREIIAREWTAFFYDIHEKGVEFIDNTPGNTLICRQDGRYRFFLVDLNRMKFHPSMDRKMRLLNLAKITRDPSLVKIIATQYASLYGCDPTAFEADLTRLVDAFQQRLQRRKNIKKKLGK